MSKFDRIWTMQLKVSREAFIEAFHWVVEKEGTGPAIVLPDLKTNEKTTGRIYKEQFFFYKQRNSLERAGLTVNGKMITTGNELTIELQLKSWWRYSYFGIYGSSIGIGILLFLVPPAMNASYIFSIILSVSATITSIIIQLKLSHKFLDYLQDLYTKVIRRIEELAMP